MVIKWNQVEHVTYPDRLLDRVPESELPAVDTFVTTADAVLEPPIVTVNTVLSLVAVDYPVDKLACYVSDDGCSAVTYFSLVEAAKFAKLWVPFCKKYCIQIRAPFQYFLTRPDFDHNSIEFLRDWKIIKDEYEQLSRKIGDAAQNSALSEFDADFAVFSNTQRSNHPTIVKVICENKGRSLNELPRLIYVSREKLPNLPHHYKAGAMNVLTRVSGVMTNAGYMLNVDCDMLVNNPQIIKHAMCLLLGSNSQTPFAFVQCPQLFYDALKDDPFGNQFQVLHKYLGRGICGIQGPFYGGTGCFHRRKVIYGMSPNDGKNDSLEGESLTKYGNSMEFVKSVGHALNDQTNSPHNLLDSLEAAKEVATSDYEFGSDWGSKFGWIYGSATEDILTGLTIQSRGWITVGCSPDPPGFLGCAPPGGPASMTQQKRWATGLLEIAISQSNPIFLTLTGELQFRQALAYLWILLWAVRSIPDLCYTALPAYCLITDSHFLPKLDLKSIQERDLAAVIPLSLFVIYNLYCLSEFLATGLSIRAWWNNQKMMRITVSTAWFCGFLSVVLKLLGLSVTVFEVTAKEQFSPVDDSDDDRGKFTFDNSPVFIPGGTILAVQLTALVMNVVRRSKEWEGGGGGGGGDGCGIGEIVCSAWVVLCFLPFLKGLFRKGKYGIPFSIIWKSLLLALIFVQFCLII